MQAGKLDRRVTLLRPVAPVDDGYTVESSGFEIAGERWARYVPAIASELYQHGAKDGQFPAVFDIRSCSLTRTIDATWRIRFDGRDYRVIGLAEASRNDIIRISTLAAD